MPCLKFGAASSFLKIKLRGVTQPGIRKKKHACFFLSTWESNSQYTAKYAWLLNERSVNIVSVFIAKREAALRGEPQGRKTWISLNLRGRAGHSGII